MIRLNVFIRVKEEKREAVLAAAKELVTASQKDKGCIAYDVFESATRHDVLMICETWKDAEALSAHEHTPHFMTLVPQIEELAEMKIEILKYSIRHLSSDGTNAVFFIKHYISNFVFRISPVLANAICIFSALRNDIGV